MSSSIFLRSDLLDVLLLELARLLKFYRYSFLVKMEDYASVIKCLT